MHDGNKEHGESSFFFLSLERLVRSRDPNVLYAAVSEARESRVVFCNWPLPWSICQANLDSDCSERQLRMLESIFVLWPRACCRC